MNWKSVCLSVSLSICQDRKEGKQNRTKTNLKKAVEGLFETTTPIPAQVIA